MSKQIRVGLIGYGYAGKYFHAPLITAVPQLHLATVVQQSSTSAQLDYPNVNVVPTVEQLLADDTIPLVVVATPSTNHFDIAYAALEANKHVVVEKPFTLTVQEAEQLITLAKVKQKMITVFHNRRLDGDYKTVRTLYNEGLLGTITEVQFSWDRYLPHVNTNVWREQNIIGSGIVYDLGIHFLDQALHLFGTPDTIFSDIRKLRTETLTDDYFSIVLSYLHGPKVTLQASLLRKEKGARYTLHGTNGSYIKYGEDPQEAALLQGYTPQWSNWGIDAKSNWGTIETNIAGHTFSGQLETAVGNYEHYYENIYDHLMNGTSLLVQPEEVLLTMKAVALVQQSNQLGQTLHFH